jgi:putative ABC transport system permease protein
MEGEHAIGQTILHADKNGHKERFEIVGVVRDFHFKSLHEPISPLVMLKKTDMGNIILKVRSEAIPGLIATLRSNWMMLNSKAPFTYSFLEDRFEETYRAEQKTGILLGVFAGLTILVACLGLLGLAIFTTNQRRKEIGIRKVLGASVLSIVGTLSTPVLKWIFWAMLIASPTAYYIMQVWLSDFAYRIEIQGWMFVLAGCLTVFIAFLTVAGQAARAARQDPTKSLSNA